MILSKAKSVDQILSGFNKMIADLQAISDVCSEKADANSAAILDLRTQNSELVQEKNRALTAAEKLKSIVGE